MTREMIRNITDEIIAEICPLKRTKLINNGSYKEYKSSPVSFSKHNRVEEDGYVNEKYRIELTILITDILTKFLNSQKQIQL